MTRQAPELAALKPLQPFGYRPRGPFNFIQPSRGRLELAIKTLDAAVEIFAREAMPAHGPGAFVVTRGGVIVLGHHEPSGGRQWCGLKYAFDLLRLQRYVDPLELELAEMEAQGFADVLNG